jgi:hypothetical protein
LSLPFAHWQSDFQIVESTPGSLDLTSACGKKLPQWPLKINTGNSGAMSCACRRKSTSHLRMPVNGRERPYLPLLGISRRWRAGLASLTFTQTPVPYGHAPFPAPKEYLLDS